MPTLRKHLEALGFQRIGLGGNVCGFYRSDDKAEYVITSEHNVARVPCRWDEGLRLTIWRDTAPYREECLQGYALAETLAGYGITPR